MVQHSDADVMNFITKGLLIENAPKKANVVQLNAVEGNFPSQRIEHGCVCSLQTVLQQHNLGRVKRNLCFLQITFSYSPVMPQCARFYCLTQFYSYWRTRKRLNILSDVTDHQTRYNGSLHNEIYEFCKELLLACKSSFDGLTNRSGVFS
jgi:hypothetical protein